MASAGTAADTPCPRGGALRTHPRSHPPMRVARAAMAAVRAASTRAAPAPTSPAPADSRARLRHSGFAAAAAGGVAFGAAVAAGGRSGRAPPPQAPAASSTPARPVAASAAEAPALPARLLMTLAGAVNGARAPPDALLATDRLRCVRGDARGGARGGARRQVVLVACGSFNPPTVAHLRMLDVAEAALREVSGWRGGGGCVGRRKRWPRPHPRLDSQRGFEVLGAYLSPVSDGYAKPGLAPARDRLALCAAAAADAAAAGAPVAVDAWEAGSPTPVRTLDVLRSVEARLAEALGEGGKRRGNDPSPPSAPRAVLVCGEDMLASMAAPGVWAEGHPREIGARHGVVAVARAPPAAGAHPPADALLAPGGPLAALSPGVTVVADPAGLDSVSSSLARGELAAGRSVRWLLPPSVEAAVRRRKLYGAVATA